MGTLSEIAWTTHTFNPWEGCNKVSPGCKNCYAEDRDKRWHGGENWGPNAKRFLHTDSYWRQPFKWDREAAKAGERHRVFCASLGDVCEDRRDLDAPRERLFELIRATRNLDWLLLSKRPENFTRLVAADVLDIAWVGTTVENQEWADKRIPHLLATRAKLRFLSAEPLLGPIDFAAVRLSAARVGRTTSTPWRIDWVIAGGESGNNARECDVAWLRSLRDQCQAAGVPFFNKQFGAHPTIDGTSFDLHHSKGGDPSEWFEDLRVREMPG